MRETYFLQDYVCFSNILLHPRTTVRMISYLFFIFCANIQQHVSISFLQSFQNKLPTSQETTFLGLGNKTAELALGKDGGFGLK